MDEKVNINRTLAQRAIILFMKINTGDVWEDSDQRDASTQTDKHRSERRKHERTAINASLHQQALTSPPRGTAEQQSSLTALVAMVIRNLFLTSSCPSGAGCSIKPETKECPSECSDQGRCEDGKCVCFPGFTGPDCSQSNCPGDCSNNGKCVNCVCNPGFAGPDCLKRTCPDNCNDRGRCVNGKCVCNSGFTGADCSEAVCPENCNNRGRCVNGQCVCDDGFSGADCSAKGCPNNCNNRGRCVNGQCVCEDGFSAADCSEKTCLNNCNNRGRLTKRFSYIYVQMNRIKPWGSSKQT
uniref:EGF-like domain-containing protein n=1 Tax=Neolamprologus brichardi TaxID=32507 RepID=A0A3Q4HU43_NEOBR